MNILQLSEITLKNVSKTETLNDTTYKDVNVFNCLTIRPAISGENQFLFDIIIHNLPNRLSKQYQ